MDQLKKWCLYIYEKFSKLILKLPVDKQQDLQKQIEDYLKLYEEPTFNESGQLEKPSEETIQLKLEMALKEGLLKIVMGVPFIFVINKSDIVTSSSEKKRFEEDSEFIFKHVRKFALTCMY